MADARPGQNAANNERGRTLGPDADRHRYLGAVARGWEEPGPGEYAFTRAVAPQARDHDDREQFRTGVGLITGGITADRPQGPVPPP